jgi:hypothetical protein
MTSEWRLAFEQNGDAVPVSGSAAAVADAVRGGADLRLYMTTATYEETLYFQQTYVGEADRFAGLMSHHHSYVWDGKPFDEPYVSLFKYDVSGSFSMVKWLLGDRAEDHSSKGAYGVYRWFVCDRWRLAYEHDEQGNAVAGSLSDLMEAARTGLSIRVGVRQLFGLNEDDASGPDHLSFMTTMQPMIQDGRVLSNCDFALVGAPQWPFEWSDGLHMAVMQPTTSGEFVCFLAEPGKLPFTRQVRQRAMQWMVTDQA